MVWNRLDNVVARFFAIFFKFLSLRNTKHSASKQSLVEKKYDKHNNQRSDLLGGGEVPSLCTESSASLVAKKEESQKVDCAMPCGVVGKERLGI